MNDPRTYQVNEIFYTLQGEGLRAGAPSVFVRFSGCNLQCRAESEGFDCDTEFTSGRKLTAGEIITAAQEAVAAVAGAAPQARDRQPPGGEMVGVVFTGGEPALQLDAELVTLFQIAGFYTCIETNGTRDVPLGLDWVCVSPKTAEHTLRVQRADELKYVRHYGQGIPRPKLAAQHYLISPAVQPDGTINQSDLAWCIELVKAHPQWRLSCQQHKQWRIR